jgi:quercetin dioxygenase-like cupin family protein
MKNENPWIRICPGISRRTMYQMVARLEADSRMPEHRHPQEQIVHILAAGCASNIRSKSTAELKLRRAQLIYQLSS